MQTGLVLKVVYGCIYFILIGAEIYEMPRMSILGIVYLVMLALKSLYYVIFEYLALRKLLSKPGIQIEKSPSRNDSSLVNIKKNTQRNTISRNPDEEQNLIKLQRIEVDPKWPLRKMYILAADDPEPELTGSSKNIIKRFSSKMSMGSEDIDGIINSLMHEESKSHSSNGIETLKELR